MIGLGKSGGCEKESNLKKTRKKKEEVLLANFFSILFTTILSEMGQTICFFNFFYIYFL